MMSMDEKEVTSFIVESWRFAKLFQQILSKIDINEQGRYTNRYTWYTKKLNEYIENNNMKLVNLEGKPFDNGDAVTILNADEFNEDEKLVVTQMLEPIILNNNGKIIKTGTVMLGRVKS